MYRLYCDARGWKWAPMSVQRTEVGGLREASVAVSGEGKLLAAPDFGGRPAPYLLFDSCCLLQAHTAV